MLHNDTFYEKSAHRLSNYPWRTPLPKHTAHLPSTNPRSHSCLNTEEHWQTLLQPSDRHAVLLLTEDASDLKRLLRPTTGVGQTGRYSTVQTPANAGFDYIHSCRAEYKCYYSW